MRTFPDGLAARVSLMRAGFCRTWKFQLAFSSSSRPRESDACHLHTGPIRPMFIISSPPPSFPQQAILQSSPSCHQRLLAPGAVMIATGCAAPLPPHRCIGKYFLVLLHSSVGSRPVHHQKAISYIYIASSPASLYITVVLHATSRGTQSRAICPVA